MIAKYSVRKPYTVLVGVVLIVVLGIVSLTRTVTDLLPDMSFPYVIVITANPGATPEEIETNITAPIEAGLATTTNINRITSTSRNSVSTVVLEYEQNTNMDSRMVEIQQNLDAVAASFPEGASRPNILRISPDMMPVMAVAVSYEGKNELELLHFVNDKLSPALESVEGAANINATSSVGEEIIRIVMDESKIEELNEKIKTSIEEKFEEASDEIKSGKSAISGARNQISSGSKELSDTINDTLSSRDEMLTSKQDIGAQLMDLNIQKQTLLAISDTIDSILSNENYWYLVEMRMPVDDGLKDALESLGITVNTYNDLPAAQAQIAGVITQVGTGIATLEAAMQRVDAGTIGINAALDSLNSNASLLAINAGIGAGQLAEAAAGLNIAQSQIDSAKENAIDGSNLNTILDISTVTNLLKAQNFDMPAGYVYDSNSQYLIRVTNKVTDMDELSNLVLMDMGFDEVGVIRLSDVANVVKESDESNGYAVVNGNPGILISIQKQTGYSTGESTNNLKDAFERLEEEYDGLNISILMDQSVYINMIVKSVVQNIVMGALLACIVLIAFLRSIRSTIIIALSIPLSVIFAILVMYFTGISMNMISLSGLALGIGMLVDNSIVAVENIYRLRAKGLGVKEAAMQGVNEIAGAITASTLTTVSVYAPIIFTEGVTRQLFVDLALTILYTLSASLIVAMTLVPAMAGSLFKKEIKEKNKKENKFVGGYKKTLEFALNHKIITFALAIAILIVSGLGCLSRGLDFLDMDIEADQLSATISPPEGVDYDFDTLTEKSDEVLLALDGMEGIETIGATGGGGGLGAFTGSGNSISLYMVLDPDSNVTLDEVVEDVKERTKNIAVDLSISTESMDYTAMFASGISARIKGVDIDKLKELAQDVADIMEDTEGIVDVDSGTDNMEPEFRIVVDREKAAKYSYTVAQVFSMVMTEIADSTSAANVTMDPYEYEVYIETEDQKNVVLADIENLTFEHVNEDGDTEDIPLSDICTFERTNALSTISRADQTRTLTVSATVEEGYNVTLVAGEINDAIDELNIPDGYEVAMSGEDQTINDAMEQLMLMLILAVIFIYLIMVAQFQSLLSPFIIMFTIPLAFTGGFLALLLTGITLNVLAMLGFIMLSGLIVNNGIVLVDYINRVRSEGVPKREAIIDAGLVRLRPVLMTVLTTILSVSVIALGIGEGSTMMQPMAVVLMGGLIYGTILTLVVVPCIYDVFNRETKALRKKKKSKKVRKHKEEFEEEYEEEEIFEQEEAIFEEEADEEFVEEFEDEDESEAEDEYEYVMKKTAVRKPVAKKSAPKSKPRKNDDYKYDMDEIENALEPKVSAKKVQTKPIAAEPIAQKTEEKSTERPEKRVVKRVVKKVVRPAGEKPETEKTIIRRKIHKSPETAKKTDSHRKNEDA